MTAGLLTQLRDDYSWYGAIMRCKVVKDEGVVKDGKVDEINYAYNVVL